MAEKQSIIQFNCNGFRSQFIEIKNLISKYDPDFILLQELKIKKGFNITLKGFNIETKIDSDSPHQPSVAILIKIGINYKRIILPHHIMAVGIETTIDSSIAIFSYYDNTRMKQLSEQNLNIINNSTKSPVLIMGDFNARHRMWDISKKDDYAYDYRSNEIIEFMCNNDYSILNDGCPTRISSIQGHSNSAIDLTIMHTSLSLSQQSLNGVSPIECMVVITYLQCFQKSTVHVILSYQHHHYGISTALIGQYLMIIAT